MVVSLNYRLLLSSLTRRNSKFLCCYASDSSNYESADVPELQDLPERQFYDRYHQPQKGIIYDKKPFKFLCKAGKIYEWCACGHSRTQPFCDETCDIRKYRITMRPVPFVCRKTQEYWFCNCKQTERRPFCDGSHHSPEVENAKTTVKYFKPTPPT